MQSKGTDKSLTPRTSIGYRINAPYERFFSISALITVVFLSLFSMVVISGWMLDVPAIKHPVGEERAMQGSCAVTFLLLSLALLMLGGKNLPAWRKWSGRILALAVFLVGAATFVEHTFQLDWGLAQRLWQPDNADAAALTFPGPMVPDVSLNFILLGAAMLLFDYKVKGRYYPFQLLALFVGLPSIMILLSYACGKPDLCAYFGCVKFSAETSLTFTLAVYAALFLVPARGLTTIFVVDTTGGAQIRRLAVMTVLLVPLLLLIRLGESFGLYDKEISPGLMALCFMTLVGVSFYIGAKKLDTAEEEKQYVVELLENSIAANVQSPSKLKHVCLDCGREFLDEAPKFCPDDGSELVQIVDNLRIGGVFADRYEILSELGSGGMSSVYLAKHLLMNKQVAVKVLHTHLASHAKSVMRFQQEARSVSQLSHINLIAVHDFGISGDGQAYLVMEFLNGYNLSEHIKMSDHIPWQEAILVFLQLCDGLAHAHSNGVMHRDLKPSNVMIVQDAQDSGFVAKIVDFGFAKAVDGDGASGQQLTNTGDVFGSPLYMSPEQCRGERVDHRSDIYAMGCLMYEAVCGEVPFLGTSAIDTMGMHINAPPPPFEPQLMIPDWMTEVIFKALEKNPSMRQQNALEIKSSLEKGLNASRAGSV